MKHRLYRKSNLKTYNRYVANMIFLSQQILRIPSDSLILFEIEHALNKPNLKIYPNRYRYCYISTYRQIPQIRFLISPSERESPGIVRIKENGDG